MFRNILVPVDFTLKNESALNTDVDLARGKDAKVTLLHVIETIEHVEFDEMADFYRGLETRAAAKLYGLDLSKAAVRARLPIGYEAVAAE